MTSEQPTKVILFAHGAVGNEISRFLVKEFQSDLAMVVTISKDEIHDYCRSFGIKALVFDSDKQIISAIKNQRFDLGVLAWWPHLIRDPLIDMPKFGFVNTHPSLLPYNRGKHYNFWTIVEEAPFGVTIHTVSRNIDSGDILAQRRINYDWTDNGETLYFIAQREIVALFIDSYPAIRKWKLNAVSQNLEKGSFHFASELDAASRIDLDSKYTGRRLLNLLRARTFRGHPGCWFEEDGEVFEVRVEIRRKPGG